jgi:hypothetical protein
MRRLLLSAAIAGLVGLSQVADAADLAAHRAHYKLAMDSARGDVSNATGDMSYEVTDACDGWATRQRLSMTITNSDGQDVQMVSDYATWESKDGLRMQFHMRQTTDTAVTDQVDGSATLDSIGGPGVVKYTVPKPDEVKLPAGTVFPTEHTNKLIDAAVAGKKFLSLPLFDGTGPDGAQDTFVTIANWTGPSAAKYPELAKLPSGRVHISFFDRKKGSTMPDYSVGMRYFSNGVSDDLAMDFGDFVMKGGLDKFELLPAKC